MSRSWWTLLLTALVLGGDVLFGGILPWWRLALNASVVAIIAVTILQGLWFGLGTALLASMLYAMTSVLNPIPHTIAFVGVSLTVWFVSHRIVASRSTVSFITAIISATLIYGILLVGADWLINAVVKQAVHVAMLSVAWSTGIQLIVHPTILLALWRAIGRHRYHQLTSAFSQTF